MYIHILLEDYRPTIIYYYILPPTSPCGVHFCDDIV